jgi:hypothetical protein
MRRSRLFAVNGKGNKRLIDVALALRVTEIGLNILLGGRAKRQIFVPDVGNELIECLGFAA